MKYYQSFNSMLLTWFAATRAPQAFAPTVTATRAPQAFAPTTPYNYLY